MGYTTNFDASNKADFIADISADDAETGEAISFAGASISVALIDDARCQRLVASVGNGITITLDPTVIELHFTSDQMKTLCSGSYSIGCIFQLNGITIQVFVGTMTVYDGIANL